jgi:hypothetical protein
MASMATFADRVTGVSKLASAVAFEQAYTCEYSGDFFSGNRPFDTNPPAAQRNSEGTFR